MTLKTGELHSESLSKGSRLFRGAWWEEGEVLYCAEGCRRAMLFVI